MSEKLVSIITPCYNGEKFLENYFNNILEQTYSKIELIFINDGSTDRTEQIAMSFKPKIEKKKHSFVYIRQENAGQAAAINKGIKIFNGDYLVWIDCDDILDKNNIKCKVEFMERNPQFGLAQCYGKEVLESDLNKKIRDFGRVPPIGHDKFFEDLLMKRNVEYLNGLYIVRRSAFLAANPKRDICESRRGQNLQMLLPLAYMFPCGYIKEDLFTYVIRDGSHSHDHITSEEFVRRSIEFRSLLLDTLDRINMKDREYYEKKVEELTVRNQFDAGYAYKDEKLIESKFKELKQQKYLTLRDIMLYYSFKFKAIKCVFMSLKSLKAQGKQIIKSLR